ncbi:menaquinone biosynthesis protein [Natribacillus halophilus]|uniref:Chorismate dehydratase n=1 Tax=Natribacillus halophilus TaxID=549003 RepID=A0A1G8JCT5_9BACI|nr:menaquinone biosynthesis protein [Natribacillus halophilus]SDI28891.1 futalosine synthase [Natribacillus halophilus]
MVRVGEILYTNVHPFFFYMDREALSAHSRFIPSIPARLNDAMANGEIDVGAISSFAYGKQYEDLILMPNLAVASHGPVGSIFLFSRAPIEDLDGKSIALTHSSATSSHLLKIILRRFYGHRNIDYTTMAPVYQDMLENHDACLLIGDDAIQANWREHEQMYVYDLGERWYHFTRMPMTFAVFAMRKQSLAEEPQALQALHDDWKKSEERARADGYEELAHAVVADHGGNIPFWQDYFKTLQHQFTRVEQRGLLHFYRLAHEEGYLPNHVDRLSVWDIGMGIHSIH